MASRKGKPRGSKLEQLLRGKPLRLINDVIFKAVFGPREHEPQLRELLNVLLGYKGERTIKRLTHLESTVHARHRTAKRPVLDLLVEDVSGRRFVVEVQRLREGDFVARTLYYAMGTVSNSLGAGERFDMLSPTIVVSIVDFRLFDHHERVHTRGILWDPDEQRPLTDLLELNFFELPKHGLSDVTKLVTLRDKWLHVLHYAERYLDGDLPAELACEENIVMAIKHYRQATGDYVTRMAALKQEIAERTRIGQLHDARKEGREEGRHSNAVETARKMAQDGFPAEAIARYTGLTPEEWA